MDKLGAFLDRELLVSAVVHDLRGALTAAQGWAELAGDDTRLAQALERCGELVETLSAPATVSSVQTLAGEPVRVCAPIDLLTRAIDDLQHEEMTVRAEGTELVIEILGVPAEEARGGWTREQVLAWQAEGGPGLAGARLQVAARRVGAGRCVFTREADGARIVVTIRLPRAAPGP